MDKIKIQKTAIISAVNNTVKAADLRELGLSLKDSFKRQFPNISTDTEYNRDSGTVRVHMSINDPRERRTIEKKAESFLNETLKKKSRDFALKSSPVSTGLDFLIKIS